MEFVRLFFPFSWGFEYVWFDTLACILAGCFIDFRNPWRLRNLDVLMLCAWVPLGDYEKGPLPVTTVLGYLPLFYFVPRLAWQAWRQGPDPCVINYSKRVLATLTLLAVLYGVLLTLVCPLPYTMMGKRYKLSDSAEGGMAGARSLLAGQIPYGHLERGWDAYGPFYYYLYVPFEWLFPSQGEIHRGNGYSARALTITLNVMTTLAWVLLGRRIRSLHLGLALAFAWAISPYTLTSVYWSQTGHLIPGALTTFALLGLSTGLMAGALTLAALAAAAFYPVFFIPVWAAHLGGRRGLRFVLITCAAGLALWAPMLLQEDGLKKFFEPTLIFATTKNKTTWSPWHYHPQMVYLRSYFQLLFLPFVAFATWAARRSTYMLMVALTGAVVCFTQLFSLHAPGRYHLWMWPLIMPALLVGTAPAPTRDDSA